MADVFISYASVDKAQAVKVEGVLSEAGYSVWWDRSLIAGQRYQTAIQRELTAAGAVVVLWTPSSVISDWVYSEARRAHQRGVLVQARDPALPIDDLPAPFDALHCAVVDDGTAITAAVATLAAPSSSVRPGTAPAPAASPSGGSAPARLPELVGETVGRDGEQLELLELLQDGRRAITLTGPGGAGKTRLAIAVAERAVAIEGLPDAVSFVPLETATNCDQMWSALATALDMSVSADSRADVLHVVEGTDRLLVLDNLEQVEDADKVVRELLTAGPGLRLLVTSRRPLHVAGEHEHAVPPLLLPESDSLEQIAGSGAVQLFVQTARRVRRGFGLDDANRSDIAALCRALDGLPLAIELVAARSKLLSPAALRARISTNLDVESPDRSKDSRQRTIRAAIHWSFDLLERPHQHVLMSLAIFAGGADLEAAEAVVPTEGCAGRAFEDLVFDLVDHSLVRISEGEAGEPRLHLLETVRAFGLEQLRETHAFDGSAASHAQYFYELMSAHYAVRGGASHAGIRAQFIREIPNLQAMVDRGFHRVHDEDWYGDTNVPRSDALALLISLGLDYRMWSDASRWIDECLQENSPDTAPARAAALQVRAYFRGLSDPRHAQADASAALKLLDDCAKQVRPHWVNATAVRTRVLTRLCSAHQDLGDLDVARAICAELLDLTQDQPFTERRYALQSAGLQAFFERDFESARVFR